MLPLQNQLDTEGETLCWTDGFIRKCTASKVKPRVVGSDRMRGKETTGTEVLSRTHFSGELPIKKATELGTFSLIYSL